MTTTPADEIAAELWSIRRAVQNFKPGSHVDPHLFPEQILAVTERLDALHTRMRDTFGGTPTTVIVEAVEAAAEFGHAAMAESTRLTYATAWKHFSAWCAEAGVDELPAVPVSLAACLAAMGRDGYAFATIGRHRAAVTHHHREAGHASPAADPIVERTLAGIARTIGTRQVQKAPATDVELHAMFKRMPATLAGLRDRAMLGCGYAGCSGDPSSCRSTSP